jgi:ABC-type uncharacterized transport system permease subunit
VTEPAPAPTEKAAPDAPDAVLATARRSRRRSLTGLSRIETLGLLYLLAGIALLVVVAPGLPGDDLRLLFGVGAGAPALPLDPVNAVRGIGVAWVLAGGTAVAQRRVGRWAGVALLIATALVVPFVLVAALALSSARTTNLVPLFTESLRLATPIALGALAGLWCERAGVVNIAIEGMLLGGAGGGFVVYAVLGGGQGGVWLYGGVVVAVVVGGLLAALHALLSVTFRTDQIISGVAINLLAIGLTSFLRRQVLLPTGVQSAITLPALPIPLLPGKPIFLTMLVLFVVTQVVLFRTPWGLRVRSVGEHPHAAETLGINVMRTRYQAVILGGLIAGLGGAWFSLETVGSFDDLMTNGKGFIALAALIFGKWRPWGAFGGALLFGFADALGTRIQFLDVAVAGFPVPSQFLQILPFAVTIVVLAGAIGRAIPPAAVGIPYDPPR